MSVTISGSTGITLPDSGALSTSIGDAINITSGYVSGIQLGGTGSANKLDDYEEGTWTPTIRFGGNQTGMVYAAQTGTYVKVGSLVTASCYVYLTSKGTSTSAATIRDLPFTSLASTETYTPATIWINRVSNSGTPECYLMVNSQTINLQQVSSAGVNSNMDSTNFVNNSEIMITISYQAN
tara:strand:+ start:44 stop:586 length:543 start_codon:yes stop_codon:yes gene_type:complete